MMSFDAATLTRALVQVPSVTPDAGAALDLVQGWLEPRGFACRRLVFEADGTPDVDNLFARIGTGSPHFCFAGHLDVVPPGDVAAWSVPPFSAEIENGRLIGRGAEDMKGGVAAFLAAVIARVDADHHESAGSISLLLTGDEEGPAVNGTKKVLDWMAKNDHLPDHCLVGEPTCVDSFGDVAKIGRRGSLNGHLKIVGHQGHVAYPDRAANPIPVAMQMLQTLIADLDDGTEHFAPSNLQITSVDTANPATNIIPAKTEARFNCRFNDLWNAATLEAELRRRLGVIDLGGITWTLETSSNAESFITPTGSFTDLVSAAVKEATGTVPALTTGGGTSDARFVTRYCPVIEFGLVGRTMHQVDENVSLADLEKLASVYQLILERYFQAN